MYKFLKSHNKTKEGQYDVLLIDHDIPTIRLMTKFLKYRGYTCKGVRYGSKGIEELKHSIPKLILLEILLPDMSGYDLCKMIKTVKKLEHIPIFFFTVLSDHEVKKKIPETTAEGYILKPFSLKDLEILFEYI